MEELTQGLQRKSPKGLPDGVYTRDCLQKTQHERVLNDLSTQCATPHDARFDLTLLVMVLDIVEVSSEKIVEIGHRLLCQGGEGDRLVCFQSNVTVKQVLFFRLDLGPA